ncbi:MAG TPA: aminotransferase class I/II-fold pyridoxal phosphate-dependent enzyme [Candidatus Baltobacteraceae bacterium]|nr:aminotransferase class I/II-fold pyridoxal phosphate-dependent enzyme [Candidatus Baltobacteraceae bacterium]
MRVVVGAVHGGDARRDAARYGIETESLLDCSANVDPCGPPDAVRDVVHWAAADPRRLSAYPTQRAYAQACAAIALAVGVESEAIVLGAGGAALIDAAVRFVDARAIVLPVPAFSEYQRAIAASGKSAIECPLATDFSLDIQAFRNRLDAATAGIVNTPHNPSGATLPRESLLGLLAACEERGRDLLVDEAFIDYVPEGSIVAEASRSRRSLVIRSLTKFYALAGIRVGYAVLHPDRARALRAMLPSWPLGTLELEIARVLHLDEGYAMRTRARNELQREVLSAALRDLGVRVFPSSANFLLLELPCASLDPILKALVCEYGVVVRDCRSYRGLESRAMIRVAVLDAPSNVRLAAALRGALGSA